MRAEIVMVGTELLLGEIVDTNANLLAVALRNIGMDLYYKTTVGDNEERITEVLNLDDKAVEQLDILRRQWCSEPTVTSTKRTGPAG